jgi:hypothetical protein
MAMANIRASIPAIEAYYADNGTYKGATLQVLQQRYDAGITGIKVVKANDQTYCIESTEGGFPWHKAGPAADIVPGDCSTPALAPMPPQYDPQTNVRAAIPAIEAYFADNGTYAGMTDDLLRAKYDGGLPTITLVRASRKTYCVESTVEGVTFHKAGPTRDIAPGSC